MSVIGEVGDNGIHNTEEDNEDIWSLESKTDRDANHSQAEDDIHIEIDKTDQSFTNSNNQIRGATINIPTSVNDISSHTKDLSHLSHLSQISQQSTPDLTRKIIDEFFYDDGLPYRRPPAHTLNESPCKSLIKIDNDSFHYCIMHPDFRNIHLEAIEHHIKYKDAESHKLEILKSLDV